MNNIIKKVIVTGDSFAFGHELGGVPDEDKVYEFTDHHRKHCYSGIIADKIGNVSYSNLALPGGSNERAYRIIITHVSEALTTYSAEEIFVMVSITNPFRREFYLSENSDWWPYMSSFEPNKKFQLFNDIWSIFTRYVSEEKGVYTYDLMQLLGMQNFLISNKVPYIITRSMGYSTTEREILNRYFLNTEQMIYNKRFYDNISFFEFTKSSGLPIGIGHHPLEEGHLAWANTLMKYINDNALFNNTDLHSGLYSE